MSAQPWIKFYPADWRADPALRSCTMAARGMWMEMLAIMHEAQERGQLTINGKAVSARQMATLAGCSESDAIALMTELERAGVFSRKKNNVIFSRRMEKDENRARKMRENGKRGGNPSLSKSSGKEPLDKGEDNTQKLEARSQIKDSDADASGAEAPKPDIRDRLWTEGAGVLMASGMPERQAKSVIGKLLKAVNDDCQTVLSLIFRARDERVGEPVMWLFAAVSALSKQAATPQTKTTAQVIRERQAARAAEAAKAVEMGESVH